jgi:hypothetical protein
MEYIGKPADFGQKVREDYIANRYHKPSDKVLPDWDLSGAVEDLGLYLAVGREIADGAAWPEWKPAAEWKARRDATLKGNK